MEHCQHYKQGGIVRSFVRGIRSLRLRLTRKYDLFYQRSHLFDDLLGFQTAYYQCSASAVAL